MNKKPWYPFVVVALAVVLAVVFYLQYGSADREQQRLEQDQQLIMERLQDGNAARRED